MFNNKKPVLMITITSLLHVTAIQAENEVVVGAELFGGPVTPAIVNIDMETIQQFPKWKVGDPITEKPLRNRRPKDLPFQTTAERGFGVDTLAQRQELYNSNSFGNDVGFSQTIVNTNGAGFTGVSPADTNGDIGIDYYVQSINDSTSSEILILNKSDGTTAANFRLGTLANGSGTGCGGSGGRGDPVIFFDQFAENGQGETNGKWVLTEFTSDSFCIYVSQTSDPTIGSWFIYEFQSSSGGLPDYPKFGNWGDAYYIGANEGPRQYALDRQNMIIGATARPAQSFGGPGLPGFGFQHLMPADADGQTLPPAGAPGIFMRHRDGDYHDNGNQPDVLEIFEFHVDWDDSNNSTFTGPINIEVSEFDTNLGGTNFGDLSVDQPTGTNLFPLKQPLMWRLQHRTIDDRQLIVGNMVTDVDGNDLHGVRWFQLERPAATVTEGWSLADEGTYALGDTLNRWMASTAMDGDGNIAIGYNVADATRFPGMRYAGRLATDPPGTMPQGEYVIIDGTASSGSSRYGDYTSLNVDPVDECTFWYTGQYNSSSSWSTRIASFKFEQCGCQLKLDTINITGTEAISDNNIQISWNDSLVSEITEYRIFRATTSESEYIQIATVADTSIGMGDDGSYTFDDTDVSSGTEYFYIIRASDGDTCLSPQSNESSAIATGICTLAPTFSGIVNVSNDMLSNCSLTIDWNNAASNCPNGNGDIEYSLYKSLTPMFTPDVNNLIGTVTNQNSFQDNDPSLISNTNYHYIVQAKDLDSNISEGNTIEDFQFPTGGLEPLIFNDDLDLYNNTAEAEAEGWSHGASIGVDDWRIETGDDNTTGTGSAFVSNDVEPSTDKFLVSKPFSPSVSSVLSFYHKFDFEISTVAWDGGVLEITIDDGATWIRLNSEITMGGYNVTLDGSSGANPLGNVAAWGGLQSTFTEVQVDLSSFALELVQIRWRMGTDEFVDAGTWDIDDIDISDVSLFGVCDFTDLIYMNGFE